MRNISFSLTTPQFRARAKTVTRRLGWKHLKVGDRLMGCEKCMGRKPGEPLVRLGEIEVTSVRREPLAVLVATPKNGNKWSDYACEEVRREGFPQMTPRDFVDFFCASHKGCDQFTEVTRIEFRHL
jgi:hypothetical protein